MKLLALVAAGAAVAGLTACSHGTAPSAATSSSPAVTSSPGVASSPGITNSSGVTSSPGVTSSAAPVNCRQAYNAWSNGPGKGLVADLSAIGSAAAGDMQLLTATLKEARPAIAKAARYPVPVCADPKGYWEVLLMHVNAAASSTSSAASLRAAMVGVPKLTSDLVAELKQN